MSDRAETLTRAALPVRQFWSGPAPARAADSAAAGSNRLKSTLYMLLAPASIAASSTASMLSRSRICDEEGVVGMVTRWILLIQKAVRAQAFGKDVEVTDADVRCVNVLGDERGPYIRHYGLGG